MNRLLVRLIFGAFVSVTLLPHDAATAEPRRYAASDSNSGYVHWIDLYDTTNRKITPTSTQPYSPRNTCGRCHDIEAISHGWHFNAFDIDSKQGRPSEPWIWTDARIATQLPMSYRQQPSRQTSIFDPRSVGLSPHQMTTQFGARFPGGGFGTPQQSNSANINSAGDDNPDAEESTDTLSPRWAFSGSLEIDCMICHAASGHYDFEARSHAIEEENFACAPTAAMHLGAVDGRVARIKDDADPKDEKTQSALPKVSYDADRFSVDGTMFFDLVREPDNNACYQCHSTLQVSREGIEPRWIHDDDVHLRAGMRCVDCHRNGIEHQTVRGYQGEKRADGAEISTLSCSGCHLGTETDDGDPASIDITARAGRLGSPKPLHAGLPTVHFEKLSCTACHAGPAPREQAIRMMTSLAHGLGEKERRTGQELPQIQGPVYSKLEDGKVHPQRVMWPAFWGVVDGDSILPLDPDKVYDWIRKPLRVRKDFMEELAPDQEKFKEKIGAALAVIEQETGAERAVYVTTGQVYGRVENEQHDVSLKALPGDFKEARMVAWPLAHNVRPAGWSLGVDGCVECHSEGGKIFASVVTPLGPAPIQAEPITMASLAGIDAADRNRWNRLFAGRSSFKLLVALSLAIVLGVLLIGLSAVAGFVTRQRSSMGDSRS